MAVFSAMYHTLFYPSYLQDIWATTCLETSQKRLYSLFLNLYTFRIYLELHGARSLLKCSRFNIGKLRGMSRKRVHSTFDVHFGSQEEKAAFVC